jgi:hypothetical protein
VPFGQRKDTRQTRNFAEVIACEIESDPDLQRMVEEERAACEVEAVIEERMSVYGPPEENLQAIADAYEAYRLNMGNRRYTIQDLCNMECLKKLIRMARTPEHPDSVKDIKAYRLLAETTK